MNNCEYSLITWAVELKSTCGFGNFMFATLPPRLRLQHMYNRALYSGYITEVARTIKKGTKICRVNHLSPLWDNPLLLKYESGIGTQKYTHVR